METPIGLRWYVGAILAIYWGFIGLMEKKMETTILGLGFRPRVWGF